MSGKENGLELKTIIIIMEDQDNEKPLQITKINHLCCRTNANVPHLRHP
jgi:hypothetical protein